MQVREVIDECSNAGISEHVAIRRSLIRKFKYFNSSKADWRAITNFEDLECENGALVLRCKYARQALTIPFPFHIETEVAYLMGLVAGSIHKKESLEICIDADQEAQIKAITDRLGIEVKIDALKRKRRKWGTYQTSVQYRKIRVRFPMVLNTFFKALCRGTLTIPPWFNYDQRLAWIEGYFNSPKMQCKLRQHGALAPRLIVRIPEMILPDITMILDQLQVTFSAYQLQSKHQVEIIVYQRASLYTLLEALNINRPKFRALIGIIRGIERDSTLQLTLQKVALTEFETNLYGLVLDQPLQELEYSLFEQTYAIGSHIIRQHLYHLDHLGLINYYVKESDKEYLTLSNRYLSQIAQTLRQEEAEMRHRLKYSDSNALSFYCPECDTISSYLEAMGEKTFACPNCTATTLHPVEVSQFFYFGRLSQLMQQQRMLEGGIA